MSDQIPAWFAVAFGVIFAGWWLTVEYRHALPDPYADEPSKLDVLEKTGHYPHEHRGGAR